MQERTGHRAARHRSDKPRMQTEHRERLVRLYRKNATTIVGSETSSDRLPASFGSTPYSSTIVVISSSPPATPLKPPAPPPAPRSRPPLVPTGSRQGETRAQRGARWRP